MIAASRHNFPPLGHLSINLYVNTSIPFTYLRSYARAGNSQVIKIFQYFGTSAIGYKTQDLKKSNVSKAKLPQSFPTAQSRNILEQDHLAVSVRQTQCYDCPLG